MGFDMMSGHAQSQRMEGPTGFRARAVSLAGEAGDGSVVSCLMMGDIVGDTC